MGGDVGVGVTLPACEAFLASHPQAHLLLVGQPEMLKKSRHSPGLFVRIRPGFFAVQHSFAEVCNGHSGERYQI